MQLQTSAILKRKRGTGPASRWRQRGYAAGRPPLGGVDGEGKIEYNQGIKIWEVYYAGECKT